MQNFFKITGKYIISVLLLLFGVFFLIKYLSAGEIDSQPVEMLVGSLFLLFAGILSLPFVMSQINMTLVKVLLVICFIGAGYLVYENIFVVQDEIKFQAEKAEIENRTIQRLKDIRTAQEEYRKIHGHYASNFDSLIAFIQEPVIPIVYKSGDISLNDSIMELDEEERQQFIIDRDRLSEMEMTEEQAVAQGYEVRDTTYASLYDQEFDAEVRRRQGLPPLSLDSLPYSPASGERFVMQTGSVQDGGVDQPTIVVKDPKPFGKEGTEMIPKDTLRFGSLDDPNTSGNWGSR